MLLNVLDYLEKHTLAKCAGKEAVVEGDRTISFAGLGAASKKLATEIIVKNEVLNKPSRSFFPKASKA